PVHDRDAGHAFGASAASGREPRLRPRGQLGPTVRPRHAPGLRRVPGCDGRPVPAGLRDPDYEQLHRPLRAAWRRLPLRRPVDRPRRPPLRTLTTGPAPVMTSERRPTWESSTSSTPRVTAGRSGTGESPP